MSCGSLPPVPGLIPIAALRTRRKRRRTGGTVSTTEVEGDEDHPPRHRHRHSAPQNTQSTKQGQGVCSPCTGPRRRVGVTREGVMGEQRPRRTGTQPADEPIDDVARSRGCATTSQVSASPSSGKTSRSDRHRKSERRREHKGRRLKQTAQRKSSPDRCSTPNPRVNPIFVWVRQEDSTIVDVKCEDYDKRNRILLTKTAQGWRAIPRTETLVPNIRTTDDTPHSHRHSLSRVRRSKVKRRSAAVQVNDEDLVHDDDDVEEDPDDHEHDDHSNPPDLVDPQQDQSSDFSQTWSSPVNDESHLPSHTISVHRNQSPIDNSVVEEAHPSVECSKVCDVSPLDNLLAVAELEFNQHIQSGNWQESDSAKTDSLSDNDKKGMLSGLGDDFNITEGKDDDCDYNEEDENNIAMDDILNRLEQSLRSPDTLQSEVTDPTSFLTQDVIGEEVKFDDSQPEVPDSPTSPPEILQEDFQLDPNSYCSENLADVITIEDDKEKDDKIESLVESSTIEDTDEMPTDLRVSKECLTVTISDDLMPTDLTMPRGRISRSESPRPSSPIETIQSPQPSGLPAILPSPDPVTINSKSIPQKSEVTTTLQKEPIDFGKGRKSASPTITCSEEVKQQSDEPKHKKPKLENITLKTILDASLKNEEKTNEEQIKKINTTSEPSRLLELLTSESADQDPITQLHQLQLDPNINLPDPMLVPKDRLSQILMSPGKEIPRLLSQRPELRLPEALAFPHLLQDPDILVITLFQLEMIIQKQGQLVANDKGKSDLARKKPDLKGEEREARVSYERNIRANSSESGKSSTSTISGKDNRGNRNEVNADVNLSNNTALAQMMWLPYLQQLEMAAMAFGNNTDFMKMLNGTFPTYPNQMVELPQMLTNNRFPPVFPMPSTNYTNPFEMPLWHDPSMLGNIRPRGQFDTFCAKNQFRDNVNKSSGNRKSHGSSHKFPTGKSTSFSPNMFPSNNLPFPNMPHPMMNMQGYQSTSIRPNLQIPQYNPSVNQKQLHKTEKLSGHQEIGFKLNQERNGSGHKVSYNQQMNSLANNLKHKQDFNPFDQRRSGNGSGSGSSHDFVKKSTDGHTQPIDLSGANLIKTKPNRHMHAESMSRHMKYDDVPEVGSTTTSIEEMASHLHESQNHLWHPLFGNQKNPSNPWNWPTVTATGE